MRKLIVSEHISLDGFVAGPGGEMDWINVDERLFEFAGRLTGEADTALYGRVTWQMMDSYWPTAANQPAPSAHDIQHSRWYNSVEKVVISRSMQGQDIPGTRIISDDVGAEIRRLKEQPGKSILMFGSPTAAHSLMADDLIDEYWLFVNPILLGEGIALFNNIRERVSLNLIESIPMPSGVLVLHYAKAE